MILNLLTGCSDVLSGKVINNYCLLYTPVYDSKKDTVKTREQILPNNAIWEELCTE